MTVWVCYEACYDYNAVSRYVVKVVDSIDKVLEFVSEVEPTETDWRDYEEFSVS